MPQCFHFRVVSAGEVIEDPIGIAALDLEKAHSEAVTAVEELRTQGELPEDAGDWHLEIRSASGVLLRSIQLARRDLPQDLSDVSAD